MIGKAARFRIDLWCTDGSAVQVPEKIAGPAPFSLKFNTKRDSVTLVIQHCRFIKTGNPTADSFSCVHTGK